MRCLLVACGVCASILTSVNAWSSQFVYIATNAARPGMGIARAQFDAATGALTKPELVIATNDPAFLLLHPNGRHLYVANTQMPGGVTAFAIDPATGTLKQLNHRASPPGRGPSHVGLDRTGRFIFDANYGQGHVRVHALAADGGLGEETAFVAHAGSSVHPQRQNKPYAHCILAAPDNRFVLVADLGIDQLVAYRFDVTSGALSPNDPPFAKLAPGAGPRHFLWHPNARWLYVVNELANTVTAFAWDGATGALTELHSVPTLPVDFTGSSSAAEIGIHANGEFLYTSNRGHDSIARFAIDESTGRLTPLGHTDTRGKTPRYFVFDHTQQWMLVTHQDSDSIGVLRVDAATGELTPHGDPVAWAKPLGIALLPVP